MPEHGAAFSAAGPVVEGVIHGIGEGAAIGFRPGEDVVLVRRIADALHQFALLCSRGRLGERISQARQIERIAMQFGEILCYAKAFEAPPRTLADAIASIDRGLAALGL